MESNINVPDFSAGWGHASGLASVTAPCVPVGLDQAIDRLLISEVIAGYCWSVDEERYDLMLDVLTEDFDFQGVIAGVAPMDHVTSAAELVSWLQAWQTTRNDQLRHRVTNIIVSEQSANSALAHGYIALSSTTAESVTPLATAFYRFTMAKQTGRWQIASIFAGFDRAF
jgi:hypothetical protein